MSDTEPPTNLKEASRVPREERAFHSSRISESCRYLGFGLVAFYYGLAKLSPPATGYLFSCIGVFGAVTLLADYFHYLGGYLSAKAALKNPRRNFKKYSLSSITQRVMFWVKQITALAGSIALTAWVLGYRF